jgi:hypothetical protein
VFADQPQGADPPWPSGYMADGRTGL